MEYIYAALLLHRLGKTIDDASITKVMHAAGATVDEAKVKTLIASLNGVDIEKELANASVMAAAPAASGSAPAAEEKKEEVKTEAAAEGLSALFG
ncbi:MAG: 50S ribosomal protein L12 [Nanoarchaeota archaeon]